MAYRIELLIKNCMFPFQLNSIQLSIPLVAIFSLAISSNVSEPSWESAAIQLTRPMMSSTQCIHSTQGQTNSVLVYSFERIENQKESNKKHVHSIHFVQCEWLALFFFQFQKTSFDCMFT